MPSDNREHIDEVLADRNRGDKRVPTPVVGGTGKRGGGDLSHRGQDERDLTIGEETNFQTKPVSPELEEYANAKGRQQTLDRDIAELEKATGAMKDELEAQIAGKYKPQNIHHGQKKETRQSDLLEEEAEALKARIDDVFDSDKRNRKDLEQDTIGRVGVTDIADGKQIVSLGGGRSGGSWSKEIDPKKEDVFQTAEDLRREGKRATKLTGDDYDVKPQSRKFMRRKLQEGKDKKIKEGLEALKALTQERKDSLKPSRGQLREGNKPKEDEYKQGRSNARNPFDGSRISDWEFREEIPNEFQAQSTRARHRSDKIPDKKEVHRKQEETGSIEPFFASGDYDKERDPIRIGHNRTDRDNLGSGEKTKPASNITESPSARRRHWISHEEASKLKSLNSILKRLDLLKDRQSSFDEEENTDPKHAAAVKRKKKLIEQAKRDNVGLGWTKGIVDDDKKKNSVEKACWEGYHQEGMKEKDGKQVPNCVPNSTNKSAKGKVTSWNRMDSGVRNEHRITLGLSSIGDYDSLSPADRKKVKDAGFWRENIKEQPIKEGTHFGDTGSTPELEKEKKTPAPKAKPTTGKGYTRTRAGARRLKMASLTTKLKLAQASLDTERVQHTGKPIKTIPSKRSNAPRGNKPIKTLPSSTGRDLSQGFKGDETLPQKEKPKGTLPKEPESRAATQATGQGKTQQMESQDKLNLINPQGESKPDEKTEWNPITRKPSEKKPKSKKRESVRSKLGKLRSQAEGFFGGNNEKDSPWSEGGAKQDKKIGGHKEDTTSQSHQYHGDRKQPVRKEPKTPSGGKAPYQGGHVEPKDPLSAPRHDSEDEDEKQGGSWSQAGNISGQKGDKKQTYTRTRAGERGSGAETKEEKTGKEYKRTRAGERSSSAEENEEKLSRARAGARSAKGKPKWKRTRAGERDG